MPSFTWPFLLQCKRTYILPGASGGKGIGNTNGRCFLGSGCANIVVITIGYVCECIINKCGCVLVSLSVLTWCVLGLIWVFSLCSILIGLIQSFCEQHYDMDSEITSNCCSLLLLSLLLFLLLLLGEHRDKVDSNYLHKCDSSIAHEYVHS
jgi:hypothetical protein